MHARVVVIKLAVHIPALAGVQIANGVAQRRLAGVAHVQGAGRVGRHKLHQEALAFGRLLAKRAACGQHFAHHLLFGRRFEADIDKAWPGDL